MTYTQRTFSAFSDTIEQVPHDTLQDMSEPIYHSADFSWLLLNPLKPLTHAVLDIINFLFPKKLLQICSKAKLCSQLPFSIFDIKKQFSPKFSICVYYSQFNLPSSNTGVKKNIFLLFLVGDCINFKS